MNYDPVNNNIWPNGMTLTNCTYVHCGEGTTGTIENCNYCEVGDNNSVSITDSEYVTIGDDNTDISINNASYIIVGTQNNNVSIGTQRNPHTTVTRTGASSVSVARRVVAVDVTGKNIQLYKTKYGEIDGVYNEVSNSGSVILTDGTGNKLDNCRSVEVVKTNNNIIKANNLNLTVKEPFMAYTKYNNATSVESTVVRIAKQTDSVGTVLDTQVNTLTNQEQPNTTTKQTYTKVGGIWALVEENK